MEDKMKKRLLPFLFGFVFCCSVEAAVSYQDVNVALSGTLDGVLSVVASAVAGPNVRLQGVGLEIGQGDDPVKVTFTRSDLSTYSSSLSFYSLSERTWYETLFNKKSSSLTPFREKAISSLEASDYSKGELILDGSIVTLRDEDASVRAIRNGSNWSSLKIPIWVSLIISGTRLEHVVLMEGVIEIRGGENGVITIYSEDLRMNGESITFEPFVINY